MNASVFIGSITAGPSLFLLKKFYPSISPADCSLKDFPYASTSHSGTRTGGNGVYPPALNKISTESYLLKPINYYFCIIS